MPEIPSHPSSDNTVANSPPTKAGAEVDATLVAAPGQEPPSLSPSLSGELTVEVQAILSASQKPDEIGRIGPFRVLRVLGKGGMGIVFEAEDTQLERRIALKVMKGTIAEENLARDRFLREAKSVGKIRSDNVVTIYQVGEVSGAPYLAMEILQGEALDDRLNKGTPLPLKDILRLGRDIAQGLAAAHERGLIHRDIKPANIWIEPTGRAKILDFGLARPIERDAHLTSTGSIVGTPAYMAPEQARGEEVDARADLFSLGCVLYRLTTGSMAFKGDSAMDVLVSLATKTPSPVSEISPQTPPALVALIHRLLSKERDGRPASAKEVVEAIKAIEEPQSCASNAPPPRRKRLVPALAAVFLALIAVAGIVYFMQTPKGTVRIEINDPQFEVTLAKTGATIKGVAKEDIKLEPGEHGFRVKRGDLDFETDKFILKKGETVTLKVELLKGKVQVTTADGTIIGEKALKVELPPIDDRWEKEIAALPPKQQAEAVAAKLKERNPGFDGKFTHMVEANMLTTFGFLSDNVTDLTPLRALKNLKKLRCSASTDNASPERLSDLSPLRGMKLQAITTSNTLVSDLTPLKDMPLVVLNCENNRVSDLTPLQGMPLEDLRCGTPALTDLSPLRGMPLNKLDIRGSSVTDLSPLQGMKLTSLGLRDMARLSDLSPLKGMPLNNLDLAGARLVSDLTPIKDMPLITMEWTGSNTDKRDEAILRSMKTLEQINKTPVANFWKKAGTGEEKWTPLFNGKDLTGWTSTSGLLESWTVEGGAITCKSDGMKYLMTERDDFGDFHLRAEVKINATGNSGLYFRAGKPLKAIGDYEAQISFVPGQSSTGSLYGLAKANDHGLKPDTWITLEVIAKGDRIQILVNGEQAVDYTETRPEHRRKGYIALQHHDANTKVYFRKIEVMELKPDALVPPIDAREHGDSKFKFFPKVLSWKEAKAACEMMGGRLAVVDTKEKDAFVYQLLKDSGEEDVWLGATDEAEEGVWVWLNGKKMEYQNWGKGNPNNKDGEEHYLLLSKRTGLDGKWYDQPLSSPVHTPGFICEWQTPSKK